MWNQPIPVGLEMEDNTKVKMVDIAMRELSHLVEKVQTQEDGLQLSGSKVKKAMAVA